MRIQGPNRPVRAPEGAAGSSGAAGQAGREARHGGPPNPRKALVREELINKAAEVFQQKGFAQTSIKDIAEALALGRSAVYHYFRNKEELLAAIIERETTQPYDELLRSLEGQGLGAGERLRRLVTEGIVRRLTAGPRFRVLIRLEAEMPEYLSVLYRRSRRHIFDAYVQIIRDGMNRGEFRAGDATVAAFGVIGMANWTSWWFKDPGKYRAHEVAEMIADMALRALTEPLGGRSSPDSLGAAIRLLKEDVLALERLTR